MKFCCRVLVMLAMAAVVQAQSPAGLWTTLDDATGQPSAIVELTLKDETLRGTVRKVFPQPGDLGRCSQCSGDFKDKPIVGLGFLWGLKDRGQGIWLGGHILDPKTGQVYRVKLKQEGNKLLVRAYYGLAILGRTQVWVKP